MRRRSFLFGAAWAAWGAPRPFGTIAYILHDGLWIREAPNGRPYRLVSGARIDSPRFSPSGKWIRYFRAGVPHVVSIDGGSNVDLGKAGCQWSPAGDELLVDGPAGLNIWTADSGWRGATRTISGASLPVVFSPDGKEIVYGDATTNGRGPGGEPMRTGRLCRLALQAPDSRPKVLGSEYLAGKIPCAWSRNGEYIVFWNDPEFSASLMADGLELFRIPAAGGAAQSLGISTLVHSDMLCFSPAQDKLAVSTGGGRNEWEEKRIAAIDLETAAISYLTPNSMAAVTPAWSPSGAAIAYSAASGPSAAKWGGPTGPRLTPPPASLQPLGQERVQGAPRGPGGPPHEPFGGGEQARRLLAGRRIWVGDVKLTGDSRYRDEEPVWSADGQHILFCRMAHDNSKTLWLMGADGTDAVQLAGPLAVVDDSWFGYYGYISWHDAFDTRLR
jgi:Tol biopolymer transport system component